MTSRQTHPDPDDMFADSRMTFGEHIEDLRTHLIRAIKGFVVAVLLSFIFAPQVLRFIAAPVESQLDEYWKRYYQGRQNEVLEGLKVGKYADIRPIWTALLLDKDAFHPLLPNQPGLPKNPPATLNLTAIYIDLFQQMGIDDLKDPTNRWLEVKAQVADPVPLVLGLQPLLSQIAKPPGLTTLSIQEPFMVYFKVAMVTGFVVGSPWIFMQIWAFIAAGLYPQEKRLVNIYLPFSIMLFIGGVLVCQFLVMPKAIEALLWFNELGGFAPDLRLSEWLGFAIWMPVVFGLAFQTPLAMLMLERIGIFSVDTYREKRRISWFLLCLFAAFITPSIDPFSMMFLAIPLCLLYELGIGLCLLSPRPAGLDVEPSESEELVEV